jgi:putative transcriptional regulator
MNGYADTKHMNIKQWDTLTNHFLIAMPGMGDPFFARTVTYLCQHSVEGALGIVLNRPSELTLVDVMDQMKIDLQQEDIGKMPIYLGGPIQPDRGFVLHETGQNWDSTLRVSSEISMTTSRDILEAMGEGKGPKNALIALGYAGWTQGQLEREIIDNAWLNTPGDRSILFDFPPAQRWKAAADLVGIDIRLLTTQAGHA